MPGFLGAKEPVQAWIEPGWQLYGGEQGMLPTFVAPKVRVRPPPDPAGIHTCNEQALQRWQGDAYRFPPYQYRLDSGLVSDDNRSWRYASSQERELLLNFRLDHTFLSMSSKDAKDKKQAHEDLRNQLLAETFHCGVVAIFLGELFYDLGYLAQPPSSDLILPRLGEREKVAPRGRHATAKKPVNVARDGRWKQPTLEEALVLELLRRQSHLGGDIRSTALTGVPTRWPRNHIPAAWWVWKEVVDFLWTHQEHINALELRSDLVALRWRLRVAGNVGTRGLHLLDSQVGLGVLGRGRSSSRALAPVAEKTSALSVGGCFGQLSGYVHTLQNPADAGSRRTWSLPE